MNAILFFLYLKHFQNKTKTSAVSPPMRKNSHHPCWPGRGGGGAGGCEGE